MPNPSHTQGTGLLAGACAIFVASLFLAAAFSANAIEPASASSDAPARPAPPWLAQAKAKLPSGLVAGRVMTLDEVGGTARIAVFPAGAASPKTPGSAFNPGQVLEVTLKREDDVLVVASTRLRPRQHAEVPVDDAGAEYEAEVLAKLAKVKPEAGVTLCQIRGWSADQGRKGLAVRAAPSEFAPIVGRLGAPLVTAESGQGSEAGWRAEFDITGYKAGWFRINRATPPGDGYEDPLPRSRPRTYSGTGWVKARDVSGAYSNTQMPVPRLLLYPHVDAPDLTPGSDLTTSGGALSIDGNLERVHACSAGWALTTSRDGQRGWWRGLCSNQVTNCS